MTIFYSEKKNLKKTQFYHAKVRLLLIDSLNI